MIIIQFTDNKKWFNSKKEEYKFENARKNKFSYFDEYKVIIETGSTI